MPVDQLVLPFPALGRDLPDLYGLDIAARLLQLDLESLELRSRKAAHMAIGKAARPDVRGIDRPGRLRAFPLLEIRQRLVQLGLQLPGASSLLLQGLVMP